MIGTGLRIGRHYGPGGKYLLNTLQQALDEPSSAIQIFSGNPHRYWPSRVEDEDERAQFVEQSKGFYKVVHACYLTNIAEDPITRSARMTRHSLTKKLVWAERMGFNSVVFHPGSAKEHPREQARTWCAEALTEVMINYEGPVQLLLENDAGDHHGRKIGTKMSELLELVEMVGDPRLGICIDTTHAYAAGYTPPEYTRSNADKVSLGDMTQEMQKLGDRLRLVHFNTPDDFDAAGKGGVRLGSHTDRHSSNFDEGVFTLSTIKSLFRDFRHLPLIMEGTPRIHDDVVHFLRWIVEAQADATAWNRPPVNGSSLRDPNTPVPVDASVHP